MMAKPLIRVQAGPTAFSHLSQHGLNADDIDVMVGASGGPKWFCLFGLDQYLSGEFFANRQKPLHLLGSSAGAWRFACFAQQDPVAASQRFCQAYATITYPAGSNTDQVTDISARIIDDVFPDIEHLQQVIDNPVFKLNLVVARAKKLTQARHKALQAGGLALAATANLFSRRYLHHFFQRVLFHTPGTEAPFHHAGVLPTQHVALSTNNLRQAVLASGSIPLVLHPVVDIPLAGQGLYYDGGITDYHFDLPFSPQGLVLYPHFYPRITPGWFDKSLKWRRPARENLHNVILVCPSEQWIASLPYKKIPDRNDFKLTDKQRINYWQTVIERSEELAYAFKTGQYQLELMQ